MNNQVSPADTQTGHRGCHKLPKEPYKPVEARLYAGLMTVSSPMKQYRPIRIACSSPRMIAPGMIILWCGKSWKLKLAREGRGEYGSQGLPAKNVGKQ